MIYFGPQYTNDIVVEEDRGNSMNRPVFGEIGVKSDERGKIYLQVEWAEYRIKRDGI